MADAGTSVTLIFYRVGPKWWEEPALNLIAAAAQMSAYTHVEIAIGEAPGQGGMMANVARIFNDQNGAEVTQRTGKNPGTPPSFSPHYASTVPFPCTMGGPDILPSHSGQGRSLCRVSSCSAPLPCRLTFVYPPCLHKPRDA